MLLRKLKAEWEPAENKSLKVGETIEMSECRSLILSGMAEAVDPETLAPISSYDLYGVIAEDEKKDFEEYLELKKQKAIKKHYEEEAAKLKLELEKAKKEDEEKAKEASKIEPKFVETPKVESKKK